MRKPLRNACRTRSPRESDWHPLGELPYPPPRIGGSPAKPSSNVLMLTFPDLLFLCTWMMQPWMTGLPGFATGMEKLPSAFLRHCRSGSHPRSTLILPTGSWIGTPCDGSLLDSSVRTNWNGLPGVDGGVTMRKTFPYCSNRGQSGTTFDPAL